jgi:hypothetical protein
MVNQNLVDNITISVVGGVLSGLVVVYASGGTLTWPTWAVSLGGVLVMGIMIIGMMFINWMNGIFEKK